MKIICACVLCLLSPALMAEEWSGTVTVIKSFAVSKAVLFKLSGELKSPARCNDLKMYAINLESPGGEAIFDLIKYAHVNKILVKANSLGTCSVYWKAEGVKDIVLLQ